MNGMNRILFTKKGWENRRLFADVELIYDGKRTRGEWEGDKFFKVVKILFPLENSLKLCDVVLLKRNSYSIKTFRKKLTQQVT